ncbi:MAG: AbrB family transcriptional regulator [Marinibacterium sp.]
MSLWYRLSPLAVTARTLAVGAAGAWLAQRAHLPAAMLTGPALAVTLMGLAGMRQTVLPPLRDLAFLILGIGIGSIITFEATAAVLHGPLIFVALATGLVATMVLGQWLLTRFFGFDRRSAVIAVTPGHLSYAISLGASLNLDLTRVTIVQSIRLLSMTLIVPALALTQGIEVSLVVGRAGPALAPAEFAGLLLVALILGLALQSLHLPAALLLGAMTASALAHLTGWVAGGVSPALTAAAFVIMGTLIGTRFSGVGWRSFVQALGAGVATTLAATLIAALMALPVAWSLGQPFLGILAAFAPGGFELMIALGVVLGAGPGLVTACHVARLIILTGLVPLMLARAGRRVAES